MAENQPKIKTFFDNTTGEMIPREISYLFPKKRINELTEIEKTRLFNIRGPIECGQDLLFCPFCMAPLVIRGGDINSFQLHLSHRKSTLGKDCPYRDKKKSMTRDEILRAHFNGAKEGTTHKYLKSVIIRSFAGKADTALVESEKRVTFEDKKWRRPDVHISYKGRDIVFEVQLVSTFVDVISGRNMAYRGHGWYILWVLDGFADNEMNDFYRRDIASQNNNNIFALDNEAIARTLLTGKLHLKVRFPEYSINKDTKEIEAAPAYRLVDFNDLFFDEKTHQVYLVDSAKEYQKLLLIPKNSEPQKATTPQTAGEPRLIRDCHILNKSVVRALRENNFQISEELYDGCLKYIKSFPYENKSISNSVNANKERKILSDALVIYCIYTIQKQYPGNRSQAVALFADNVIVFLSMMALRTWSRFGCVACRNFPNIAGVANNMKIQKPQYGSLFLKSVSKFGIPPGDFIGKNGRTDGLKALKKVSSITVQATDLEPIAAFLGLI